MDIKAVLFDVDGTLLNVEERFYHHYNETLAEHGFAAMPRDRYEALRAVGNLSEPLPDGDEHRAKFWMSFIEGFSMSDHIELGRPFPGAHESLEWLKANGYRMAVITGRSSPASRVESELTAHGLMKYFEFALANNNGIRGMNKAANLVKAAEMMKLDTSNCAYVGDWQGDVENSKEAGIGSIIAVLSGGERRETLERFGPHVILNSIAEVPEFIKSLNGHRR